MCSKPAILRDTIVKVRPFSVDVVSTWQDSDTASGKKNAVGADHTSLPQQKHNLKPQKNVPQTLSSPCGL